MVGIDLGFCWAFGSSSVPEDELPYLRDCGFDGIELWPQALEQFGVARWARTLRNEGMRALQLCPYFNFVGGPEKVWASREMFFRYLEMAQELECSRLRVFTGPPWGEGVVGAKAATEAQWASAIENLREYGEVAGKAGVELCLECHEGSLMEDAPSALRLLRAVDHPALTTNLQLPLLNEAWERSLELLGAYTSHIHIHNWTEGLGRGEQTYLGEGAFDWLPVINRLVGDFERSLCLSVEHPDHGGKSTLRETARRDGATLRQWRRIAEYKKVQSLSKVLFCRN